MYRMQTRINLRQLPGLPHRIASPFAVNRAPRRHLDLEILHPAGVKPIGANNRIGHVNAGSAGGGSAGAALVTVDGDDLLGGPDGAVVVSVGWVRWVFRPGRGGGGVWRSYWQFSSFHLQAAVSDFVSQVCLDWPVITELVLSSLRAASKSLVIGFGTDQLTVVHDCSKAPMSSWQSPLHPILPMACYQSL